MGAAPEITNLLDELKISYRWVDHPPVFTVAESLQHIQGKRPVKNLLLAEKGGGRNVLVIMAGEDRLDPKLIAARLGTKKLHFASADALHRCLGVTPGSVSVFGLINAGATAVEVVVDKKLLNEVELGFHPNVNTATIFIPGQALGAIIARTGHKFELLDF